MTRSVVFVAWGTQSLAEIGATLSAGRLPSYSVHLVTDEPEAASSLGDVTIHARTFSSIGFPRKLEALAALPPELGTVLYLDSDARVLGDVTLGYVAAERWGIAAAPAPHYALEHFRAFADVMRREGVEPMGQVVYNAGVLFLDLRRPDVRNVLAAAHALSLRYPGYGDQPFLTLAMEQAGLNPYALSASFNHRAFGELISGDVRVWHSRLDQPEGVAEPDEGYLRRVEDGALRRVMKVPSRRAESPIVLHVGAGKTGSTYLQTRLRADSTRLRDQGVHVPISPGFERIAANAKLLATSLADTPSPVFARAFPEVDHGSLDPERILRDLLADWRLAGEAVVLSSETFRPSHAPLLRDLLPVNAECRVVLYVRRQDRWIGSYHNQYVKTFQWHNNLSALVDVTCGPASNLGEHSWIPDWYGTWRAWSDAFGDCRVIIYEEAKDGLFEAFFDAAGLPRPSGIPEIGRTQESLHAHSLLYLLEQPHDASLVELGRRLSATREVAARLQAPDENALLSSHDLRRIRERFAASNARLLEEALGRRYEGSPLEIPAEPERYVSCDEIRQSAAYQDHRHAADALLQGTP